ncbi:Phage regulatory protein Rha (Phage_pRha) [Bacteroides salyersiae]|uniref:Rha family transcriptional regulator n=1 Tax=Bacteroides salyersiae TaxID=291644 RepID=UPI001B8C3CFE|nr:Rha family transcriptional regulator [Bacteroides salyersiae]QUT74884.1 Phage regulatory protein Rha (Phage_pRha) [Bacteroides salyersiae]
MTDIVFQGSEGQPLTSSVLVAEKFDKRHCDIIKKIKGLLNDSPQKCGQFFVSSTYTDSSGKENLMYIMNRDGFTLLAMGFTGQKALQFKLDYIDAFNKMEQTIRNTRNLPSSADTAMLKQLVETTQTMAAQISRMQEELDRQRDMLLLPSANVIVEEPRISPRQWKYYTVKQMAKELHTDSRLLNDFLEYMEIQEYNRDKQRWMLNQSLIGLGYTYTVVYEPVNPDEEPREYMVWTPKGKEYINEKINEERRKYQENRRKENSL